LVTIPAGVRQRISNIGDRDLIFYCLCTPRFEQKNYRALE
jgi:mannose-6-phosphate isomerase-like protein (cupin superfamily)